MSKAKYATVGLAVLSVLTLAACSKGGSSASNDKTRNMPLGYKNSAKAIKGGTLKMAEVSDSPFNGSGDPALSSDSVSGETFSPTEQDLLNTDKHYKFINGGPANYKLDKKAKTVTLTIRKGLKWSDGKPVTAKDIEYAQEVVAAPDSTSEYFSESMNQIVGMDAFHAGKSKTISGISMPNGENGDKVVIHYKAIGPGIQYGGAGYFWEYAEPYHYLKNIPISKLASSTQIKSKPLTYSPFKVAKVVQGESVTFTPNKYYWGSKPKLDRITVQVVSTSAIQAALKAHKYDATMSALPGSKYPQISKTTGYKVVGDRSRSISYLGFNLGHFDTQKSTNVMDKSKKMSNVKLRQAMGYALNVDAVEKKFSNGLGERATTLIPKFLGQYHDSSAKGFPLNIKKANKLLDDAGYKKHGKYRTDPNGKKLVIKVAASGGSSVGEATLEDYMQQWRKIGLDVQYVNGKPMEGNAYLSLVQKPSSNAYDVFLGGWTVAVEPSPAGLYGPNEQFNLGHFVSKENTQLLKNIDSTKSFDTSYRKSQFDKWQTYMNKQAAYVPTSEGKEYYLVNKRVKNYTLSPVGTNELYANLAVTSNSTASK